MYVQKSHPIKKSGVNTKRWSLSTVIEASLRSVLQTPYSFTFSCLFFFNMDLKKKPLLIHVLIGFKIIRFKLSIINIFFSFVDKNNLQCKCYTFYSMKLQRIMLFGFIHVNVVGLTF